MLEPALAYRLQISFSVAVAAGAVAGTAGWALAWAVVCGAIIKASNKNISSTPRYVIVPSIMLLDGAIDQQK
jgi:hypothetical protein